MSVTPNDHVAAPDDVVAATREFIRGEGDYVVSICQLLDELSDMFGDRFAVSPDTYKVLDLIETLRATRDQVPHGCIDFACKEEGRFCAVRITGLLGRVQIPSATKRRNNHGE